MIVIEFEFDSISASLPDLIVLVRDEIIFVHPFLFVGLENCHVQVRSSGPKLFVESRD